MWKGRQPPASLPVLNGVDIRLLVLGRSCQIAITSSSRCEEETDRLEALYALRSTFDWADNHFLLVCVWFRPPRVTFSPGENLELVEESFRVQEREQFQYRADFCCQLSLRSWISNDVREVEQSQAFLLLRLPYFETASQSSVVQDGKIDE